MAGYQSKRCRNPSQSFTEILDVIIKVHDKDELFEGWEISAEVQPHLVHIVF